MSFSNTTVVSVTIFSSYIRSKADYLILSQPQSAAMVSAWRTTKSTAAF